MPLSVEGKVENRIAILDLVGSLTLSPGLHTVRDTAKRILSETAVRGLVINAFGVLTADSAGLGELTVVYTLASRANCGVVLVGAKPNLITMLQVTHLDALLPTVPDVSAALSYFSQPR